MTRLSSARYATPLLVAFVLACGGDRPPVASPELLAGIPAMPGSRPWSSSAGSDAIQAGYQTGVRADSVASWYRRWLIKDGWEMSGDLRTSNGTVTLHAEKAGRPIWLIIQPFPAGVGSTFSVIGADTSRGQEPGARGQSGR